MTTYKLTITAVLDTEDEEQLLDLFLEWLSDPSHIEDGVEIEDVTPQFADRVRGLLAAEGIYRL